MIIIIVYTLVIDGLFSHQKPASGSGGGHRLLSGRYRLKDRLWEMNCGILGLFLSCSATLTITGWFRLLLSSTVTFYKLRGPGALKNVTGKPRPDLIDRCRPKEGSEDLPMFGLSNFTLCDPGRHDIWKDGFRSFPSGHSSGMTNPLFHPNACHARLTSSREKPPLLVSSTFPSTSPPSSTSSTNAARSGKPSLFSCPR